VEKFFGHSYHYDAVGKTIFCYLYHYDAVEKLYFATHIIMMLWAKGILSLN